jgi:two-component system, NarL family, response regulator NreC
MPDPATNHKIRLLLADDHPVVRAGLRSFLTRNNRMEVVGEAADGSEAVSKAQQLHPDVVFMDSSMPGMNGLEAARLLRRQTPAVKVLMHSFQNGRAFLNQVIESGAQGYVSKDASLEEMAQAIEHVNHGETWFKSDDARLALEEHSRNSRTAPHRGRRASADLTDREIEVLGKVAEGKSNRVIAAELGIGVRTVETHRERIMLKLQIHNVAGLIKFAIAKGLATI